MPYIDTNTKKRKYSVLIYNKNIKDFGNAALIFDNNFNLKSDVHAMYEGRVDPKLPETLLHFENLKTGDDRIG